MENNKIYIQGFEVFDNVNWKKGSKIIDKILGTFQF